MYLRLPSKETPYSDSVIALFPPILESIRAGIVSPSQLYALAKAKKWDNANFFSALDCLYALGRIELDEERMVLYYVEADPL